MSNTEIATTSAQPPDIWDRREGETVRAYAAFCCYRDLGVKRSVDSAYQKMMGPSGSNKIASGQYREWCGKHDWPLRAEAYDVYLEKLARLEREQSYLQDVDQYKKRQKNMAASCLALATHTIMKLLPKVKELDASKLTPSEIASLMRASAAVATVATNSEAQALGVDILLQDLKNDLEA